MPLSLENKKATGTSGSFVTILHVHTKLVQFEKQIYSSSSSSNVFSKLNTSISSDIKGGDELS